MPRIIENIEVKLWQEAKRQIEANGYGAMTIRSVAKACGVGVGTVYNYFSSKDELVAVCLLKDWKECIREIDATSATADTAMAVLQCEYNQLVSFARKHAAIFQDKTAAESFAGSFGKYHAILRSQLAQPLGKFCNDPFAPEFIAESLLVWSMNGKTFDEISRVIGKLF